MISCMNECRMYHEFLFTTYAVNRFNSQLPHTLIFIPCGGMQQHVCFHVTTNVIKEKSSFIEAD